MTKNNLLSPKVLIMVSVSDSLGGVTNLTQTVQINPDTTDLETKIANYETLL